MNTAKQEIQVFIQTEQMPEAIELGVLNVLSPKGNLAVNFEYSKTYLQSKNAIVFDPDIELFTGKQFPKNKNNFGFVYDSMPDTWGKTLIKRKFALDSQTHNTPRRTLTDIDYLLALHDANRTGAIRFKYADSDFLNNDTVMPIPPWSSVRELQYSAKLIESNESSPEIRKWLAILLAPGSSLGGARPKANILDTENNPWIAKFPAQNDVTDKALWEYLAYLLAIKAGVQMSESRVEKVAGNFHTFFTKRFDRNQHKRIHFASAMCMTGNTEERIRDHAPSYLEIAEFIKFSCANAAQNLEQLWRRIVFNIAISNTDDHLRNHGFLLHNNQWQLSPAFDINPSTDKNGLALNIDMDNNALDFELAKSTGIFYGLNNATMNTIINEVTAAVSTWHTTAKQIGIPNKEIEWMRDAFVV